MEELVRRHVRVRLSVVGQVARGETDRRRVEVLETGVRSIDVDERVVSIGQRAHDVSRRRDDSLEHVYERRAVEPWRIGLRPECDAVRNAIDLESPIMELPEQDWTVDENVIAGGGECLRVARRLEARCDLPPLGQLEPNVRWRELVVAQVDVRRRSID